MRILVCGGRDFLDEGFCWQQLQSFHMSGDGPITEIIHGGARGADSFAGRWGKGEHIKVRQFPADWKKHGKAAGPIRNQEMLGTNPDAVLAFKGGKGTADMVRRAEAAGIRVERIGWAA